MSSTIFSLSPCSVALGHLVDFTVLFFNTDPSWAAAVVVWRRRTNILASTSEVNSDRKRYSAWLGFLSHREEGRSLVTSILLGLDWFDLFNDWSCPILHIDTIVNVLLPSCSLFFFSFSIILFWMFIDYIFLWENNILASMSAKIISLIWIASSRAGDNIRAFTESKTCFFFLGCSSESDSFSLLDSSYASTLMIFLMSRSKIGIPKHNVLPCPVLAVMTRSMCCWRYTRDLLWTSVGALNWLTTND